MIINSTSPPVEKISSHESFPMLIAHRGAMAEAPENTIAAFDIALSRGVHGIEFDVQLTSDGIPVVFHDENLYRVTGKNASIFDYTFDILKSLDYGRWFSEKYRGTSLLRLEDTLELYARKTILMIELKTKHLRKRHAKGWAELAERTVDLIMERVPEDRLDNVYLLSFDEETLSRINDKAPVMRTILNLEPSEYKQINTLNKHPLLYGIGLPFNVLDRSRVAQARNAGKKVMTYACNTKSQTAAALEAGADFVLTDNPMAVASYFFKFLEKRISEKRIEENKE